MGKSRRTAWALAASLAALLLAGVAVQAADQPLKVGVVDTDKVLKDAPLIKQYREEQLQFESGLGKKIDIRSQNLMLTEEEVKELIELKLKVDPTETDKQRIKELERIENDRDAELKQLQEGSDLTEAQKSRLKELQEMNSKSKSIGSELLKDYQDQAQSKAQELGEKADTAVQDAIKQVAEAEGYNLVLVKAAAVYGGTDITDAVIAKLDRKAQ